MAYKAFSAPTGTGNTVFEGDVINGYTSPDTKSVVIKFYSNDRGYTCGSFGHSDKSGTPMDAAGAKELRAELASLIESNASNTMKFQVFSPTKRFSLTREFDNTPLILGVHGTDPRFGTSYHRGSADDLKKILAEFDTVLKTIDDVAAGKAPA
jgi:hypothetical protein